MDLLDYYKKIDGTILVIVLESTTRKEEFEHDRVHVTTIHRPLVHLFSSVSEANKKLQESNVSVLGVWELKRDLSGCLVREKIAVDQERTVVDVSRLEHSSAAKPQGGA